MNPDGNGSTSGNDGATESLVLDIASDRRPQDPLDQSSPERVTTTITGTNGARLNTGSYGQAKELEYEDLAKYFHLPITAGA